MGILPLRIVSHLSFHDVSRNVSVNLVVSYPSTLTLPCDIIVHVSLKNPTTYCEPIFLSSSLSQFSFGPCCPFSLFLPLFLSLIYFYLRLLPPHLQPQDSLRDLQSRFTRTLRCCRDLLMRGARPVMREAYMTLCDILVVFGRQLRACGQLGALAYVPDSSLQQLLQVFTIICSIHYYYLVAPKMIGLHTVICLAPGLCGGGGDRGRRGGGGGGE